MTFSEQVRQTFERLRRAIRCAATPEILLQVVERDIRARDIDLWTG
jgi:hypothetical protein